MGTIGVDLNPRFLIGRRPRVSADVRALVKKQDFPAQFVGDSFGHDGSKKTGSDNDGHFVLGMHVLSV